MKTKYPNMFGLLAVFMLVASLVVPANVANPAPVQADPDILRWSILNTPDGLPPQNLIKEVGNMSIPLPFGIPDTGSEVAKVVVGSDGSTMYGLMNANGTLIWANILGGLIANTFWPGGLFLNGPILAESTTGGWIWSIAITQNLARDGAAGPVWDVAVAPDDPNFLAVVTSRNATAAVGPLYPAELWVSSDGGTTWQSTFFENQVNQTLGLLSTAALPRIYISCIDISADYGGKRDIAVGTRDAMDFVMQKVWTLQVPGFGNWLDQSDPANSTNWVDGDVFDIKFSPSYVGDATITIVASDNDSVVVAPTGANSGAFWNTGVRDLDQNTTVWGTPVYISNPATAPVPSANATTLVSACLQLPSDFSGQAASLRRAYISLDDNGGVQSANGITESGIFRVDDTTVYHLMDTTNANPTGKRISSIAYYGTYASGKLLAGEVIGDPCWATVPTWFTDSPTTCPIPCWYPAKKPTTGAANVANCAAAGIVGRGNAWVLWSPDGATSYVATGHNWSGPYVAMPAGWAFVANQWPRGLLGLVPLDESAFALSRNNGETWNQLAIIDTKLDKLTDVAPAADCTTVYLASTNNATNICQSFDSVWRTSSNPAVASPLMPLPIGNVWERVLCRPTQTDCNTAQSEYAILRLAPDKEDGQIVFWAAGGAGGGGDVSMGTAYRPGANTQAVAWSPDYGDYWANINPRLAVQDMSAESSTTLYILARNALVQRMPYTGTAWSSAIANGNTNLSVAHTIDSMAEGHVLVGAQDTGNFEAAYSADAAANFATSIGKITPTVGNNHVEFDTNFADNGIFFIADDDNRPPVPALGTGVIYRNTIPYGDFEDMLNASLTAYCRAGYFGLAVAYTGNALYGANNGTPVANAAGAAGWCTVERTIYRYWPIPKPNIPWDHLNTGTDGYVGLQPQFTLEPSSLKFCGCLTLDTDTELFAIDNDQYSRVSRGMVARQTGMVWVYTDCLAKVGPTLIMEDGTLIGCDPVSGRNQEINFQWEQLCLAAGYDVEIAKDETFTMKVVDYTSTFAQATLFNTFVPQSPMAPAWLVPAAAWTTAWAAGTVVGTQPAMYAPLECGHKYYWRVKVRADAWAGTLRSPWSEVRSFTIKAGLPVTTPYYGPQLLSPNNGCIGCPVSPASFSWSPFKGTTSYKFQLASDAAMTAIIAEDTASTTAYEYTGTLDYSTNYFWRVMSVEPAPSDWSATFSFQTGAAPEAPPAAPEAPATPLWVWVVIALGAILVIVTLVLIFKTRRV